MKHVCSAVLFSVLFFLAGCAWLSFSKNVVDKNNIPEDAPVVGSFVKTGKVIDAPRLKKGGKLLVIPFPAGVGVVANDRSDKIALMIVKGIADELKKSQFAVLNDANAHEAELLITGHVTGIGKPSKWKRWLLQTTQDTVSIEGRMVDAASKANVIVFTHSAQTLAREKDHAQLGYDIGKDIGLYLMSVGH